MTRGTNSRERNTKSTAKRRGKTCAALCLGVFLSLCAAVVEQTLPESSLKAKHAGEPACRNGGPLSGAAYHWLMRCAADRLSSNNTCPSPCLAFLLKICSSRYSSLRYFALHVLCFSFSPTIFAFFLLVLNLPLLVFVPFSSETSSAIFVQQW